MEVSFETLTSESEVSQILELQALNLVSSLPWEVAASQGFLTVRHDSDVLWRMNQAAPSILAKDGNILVGYALVMLPRFAEDVPILKPMFELLESLQMENLSLADTSRWFVMGQICIAEAYRGHGIFEGLYNHMKKVYSGRFDFTITEVSERNKRSMRAHERAGFKTLHSYTETLTGESWRLIILEF